MLNNPLFRILIVIIFALATWNGTQFSLVALSITYFTTFPLLIVATGCLWAIPAALFLPTTERTFQTLTSIALVGIYVIAAWTITDLFGDSLQIIGSSWGFYLVPLIGLIIGWFPIATRFWRNWKNKVAVQDSEAAEHH